VLGHHVGRGLRVPHDLRLRGHTVMDRGMAEPDARSIDPTIFAAILQQNSENVRSIKNQRIWFLQTFAVISAGTQSFLLGIHAEALLQLGLNLSMTAVAAMGLLISLRLKAELEEASRRFVRWSCRRKWRSSWP
jgi:hypothetical protein